MHEPFGTQAKAQRVDVARSAAKDPKIVAGDPRASEEDWLLACSALVPEVAPPRRVLFTVPVALTCLAALVISGVFIANHLQGVQYHDPQPFEGIKPSPGPHPVGGMPAAIERPPGLTVLGPASYRNTKSLNPYLADMQRRINRAWSPRERPRSLQKVAFVVAPDGAVSHIQPIIGKMSPAEQQAAVQAIQNAAPFRRLPTGYTQDMALVYTFDNSVATSKIHSLVPLEQSEEGE